jgi:hypothetical protein
MTNTFKKNKENKYIIVYDEDESIAANVATTMFQKGIDNIYLLSGGFNNCYCCKNQFLLVGLIDMVEKFPIFVIGKLPPKPGTAKCRDLLCSM